MEAIVVTLFISILCIPLFVTMVFTDFELGGSYVPNIPKCKKLRKPKPEIKEEPEIDPFLAELEKKYSIEKDEKDRKFIEELKKLPWPQALEAIKERKKV